ncbi:MAG: phosphoribosylformylglycinamidine synthase subunit PurQ [Thermodesulfobacteriota bacterium]
MSGKVKALVLAGFGINCDYETTYALRLAGAETDRLHLNEVIARSRAGRGLESYHLLAVDGGFAWADDHGAGVILGLKLRAYLGEQIEKFIADGKLIIGICNGFQALVNMGLLPGFAGNYQDRSVALAANDCGNFRNQWVYLTVEPDNRCLFTRGLENIELPVRHGEGKFYAEPAVIERLKDQGQVVMRYGRPVPKPHRRGQPQAAPPRPDVVPAEGQFPYNPNGSLFDIAGVCDETGRVFGLMPHPEAYHHLTNHPDWTSRVDHSRRWGQPSPDLEGEGLKILRNAVSYCAENLL